MYCHMTKTYVSHMNITIIDFRFSGHSTKVTAALSRIDFKIVKDITPVIKLIPSTKRNYDPIYKLWTVQEAELNIVGFYDILSVNNVLLRSHIDVKMKISFELSQAAASSSSSSSSSSGSSYTRSKRKLDNDATHAAYAKASATDARDFFKNAQGQGSNSSASYVFSPEMFLSFITVTTSLPLSLSSSIEDITRAYRKAALLLHPDRNGGDAAKMTELNKLWAEFKEYKQMQKI